MAYQTFDLTPYPSRRFPGSTPNQAGASASLIPQHLLTYSLGAEKEDTLLDYWKLLWKHKGFLLLVTMACTAIGLLISLLTQPIYQAHSSLEIEGLNRDFLNSGQVNPTEAPAPTAMDAYIHSQTEILRDEHLVSRVVSKLNLAERPEYKAGPGVLVWLHGLTENPAAAPDTPQDRAVKAALHNLKVQTAGETHVVKILYDSPDPKLAADFVNTLAGEFIDQTLQARWETSERMRDWLSRQLATMRDKLQKDETALESYVRASGLRYTQDNNSVNESRLRQVEEELSRATADRVAKQSQHEMASSSQPEWLPQTLADGPLRDYQVKLTELQRERAELGAVLTPTNYKVRRVQAQIEEVEAALKRELAGAQKRIYNEFRAAQTREQLLSAAYSRQARLVSDESFKAIRYNTLKREADTTRTFYEDLAHRVEEASMVAAAPVNNIRVIAPAAPPAHPYKPNVFLNSAIGLFAGLFLAVGLTIIRERSDRSLKAPGESTALLRVPEIGIIPAADVDPKLIPFWRRMGVQGTRQGDTVELVSSRRKYSALSEAFRETVASQLFHSPNAARARLIVLSSPGPGDGKTSVVSNLGIALAKMQRRVLLVDGDLRRSRLHQIFKLENTQGLSDLLCDKSDLGDRPLETLVSATGIPHLFLLTGGSQTADVPNILYSERLAALLARFRGKFDTVLIDAPPILYLPDARVLGRVTDGVVLVLRAGKTSRDAAVAATQRLAVDGIRVLATILNGWNPKESYQEPAYNQCYHYYHPSGEVQR